MAGRRVHELRKGRSDAVPIVCLVVFSVVWIAVAISPRYRDAWLLENGLTMIAVPAAVATYRRFPLSDRSYVLLTAFLLMHTVGSYYTYSEVPIGYWARDALGLERNHYDRVVHFMFGLLLCRPMRELTIRRPAAVGPFPTALISVALVALASVTYEVVEWWAAIISDPEAGTAFLGTQGDVWDAQWDMALACGGGIIAALVHYSESRRPQPSRPTQVRRRAQRIRTGRATPVR